MLIITIGLVWPLTTEGGGFGGAGIVTVGGAGPLLVGSRGMPEGLRPVFDDPD